MFAGTFHWIDDLHNYVSFAQQAEDGALLFRNKLVLEEHRGALVNLEWWVLGQLSRLCGGRPFLAYRLLALGALAGLLLAADRALRRCGLPHAHRFPALLLLMFGGGLGGLLFELTSRPVFRCADLYLNWFPFLEALSNPHWLVATWLLLQGLTSASRATLRGGAGVVGAGTVLGLVRPYDLVLLAGAHAAAVLWAAPGGERLRRLLPLAGLLPVALYNGWLFYGRREYQSFGTAAATSYAMPPAADVLWAIGPVLLLVLTLRSRAPSAPDGRLLWAHLWSWFALAAGLAVLRPVAYAPQFVVGAGAPLLLLAGLGLARYRPAATALAALALSSTAVVALAVVLRGDPAWFPPAPRRQAALALRPACAPGQRVFAPEDVGLYVNALTACHAYLAHSFSPEVAQRRAVVGAFYGGLSPAQRAVVLDALRVRHLVLPGDEGPVPSSWLGPQTPFRRLAVAGQGAGAMSVYSRAAPGER